MVTGLLRRKLLSMDFKCSQMVRLERTTRSQDASLNLKPFVFSPEAESAEVLICLAVQLRELGKSAWVLKATMPATVVRASKEEQRCFWEAAKLWSTLELWAGQLREVPPVDGLDTQSLPNMVLQGREEMQAQMQKDIEFGFTLGGKLQFAKELERWERQAGAENLGDEMSLKRV